MSMTHSNSKVRYISYDSQLEDTQLPAIRQLISKDLSEPYSIYVYRYFLYQWADLCFLVRCRLCFLLRWRLCYLMPN